MHVLILWASQFKERLLKSDRCEFCPSMNLCLRGQLTFTLSPGLLGLHQQTGLAFISVFTLCSCWSSLLPLPTSVLCYHLKSTALNLEHMVQRFDKRASSPTFYQLALPETAGIKCNTHWESHWQALRKGIVGMFFNYMAFTCSILSAGHLPPSCHHSPPVPAGWSGQRAVVLCCGFFPSLFLAVKDLRPPYFFPQAVAKLITSIRLMKNLICSSN